MDNMLDSEEVYEEQMDLKNDNDTNPSSRLHQAHHDDL